VNVAPDGIVLFPGGSSMVAKQLSRYQKGKGRMLKNFVGQAMKVRAIPSFGLCLLSSIWRTRVSLAHSYLLTGEQDTMWDAPFIRTSALPLEWRLDECLTGGVVVADCADDGRVGEPKCAGGGHH
jgi:hypothetical protein